MVVIFFLNLFFFIFFLIMVICVHENTLVEEQKKNIMHEELRKLDHQVTVGTRAHDSPSAHYYVCPCHDRSRTCEFMQGEVGSLFVLTRRILSQER